MDEMEAVGLGRDHPRYVCELETSTRATAAADRAAENKTTNYTDLAKTHNFVQIAIETGGDWNELALEFITELER